MTPWERFAAVARGERPDKTPVALIVDSPWLPGYAGIDTLDYFLYQDEFLRINLGLLERFPEVAWVPGFWIEYGMAVEPSAFGARATWAHNQTPSIEPVPGGLQAVADIEPPDPQQHGLMPFVLQRYADAVRRLEPLGVDIPMVAARGPLAVGGWVLGITELMVGFKTDPEASQHFLDVVTTTLIGWLRAQLDLLPSPQGILLLDDIVGMVSPQMFDEFARPHLERIFQAFPGLIKVYHNDTPSAHLLGPFSTLGFDVFNFSHRHDIGLVRTKMPGIALMGNVPPLDVMARGTAQEVEAWARDCIEKTGGEKLVLSAGGGVSPDTPAESIDALVRAIN